MLVVKAVITKSKIQGLGLFAAEKINEGTLIWRMDENSKLYKSWKEVEQNVPKDEQYKLSQVGDELYMLSNDGTECINHSCEPNLHPDLVTMRDILVGEEFTLDYATMQVTKKWPGLVCHCGAKNCRKIIRYTDILNEELQRKHKGHLPHWVLKFINESAI